ncbi:MAG: hypothetical protein EB110_08815, partial [Betaproteobacteria bacterium]|nr:hypothetical protein [Betaproteobacteria bacterium]
MSNLQESSMLFFCYLPASQGFDLFAGFALNLSCSDGLTVLELPTTTMSSTTTQPQLDRFHRRYT